MAKLRLLHVFCLLVCFVTHSGSEETETDLGVLADNFLPKLKDDNDRLNDLVKSDVKQAVPPNHDPHLPVSNSEYQSQPLISGTKDGDNNSLVRSETSIPDADQETAQGTNAYSDKSQGFDGAKAFSALDSNSKEAGNTVALVSNQLPEHDSPNNLNTHSSEKNMGVLGALERPALSNNEEAEVEKETEGQARNRLDDDSYNTQSSDAIHAHVGKLGLVAEGPVQGDKDSQVLDSQSNHTNEADHSMFGTLRGRLSESIAETKHTVKTSENRLDVGVQDTSYVRPSKDQDGNVLDNTGSLTASAFARHPAMMPEHADPYENSDGVYLEDQRNDDFEDDNKNEDMENVQVPDVRNGSYDFRDATSVRELDKSMEDPSRVSVADDLGSFQNNQQPQLYNKPDWQNDEVSFDDGDDAENEIPWAVNPFDQNTDRQIEEKDAENSMQEQIISRPNVETDQDEDVDFDDDYYDSEADDWWYFDPDRRKDDQEETAHTTWQSSSFASSTTRLPLGGAQGREGVAEEKEGKEPPHIPEGVIEIKDVKKNMNGPKESILLYTALILIVIVGIVVFTLWKNASKTTRSRSSINTMPVGEEGKRLLDHPFV